MYLTPYRSWMLRSLWCAAATSSAVMPCMSWRSMKIGILTLSACSLCGPGRGSNLLIRRFVPQGLAGRLAPLRAVDYWTGRFEGDGPRHVIRRNTADEPRSVGILPMVSELLQRRAVSHPHQSENALPPCARACKKPWKVQSGGLADRTGSGSPRPGRTLKAPPTLPNTRRDAAVSIYVLR